MVMSHLDCKDLAKAARTCKEFAEHIRDVRAGLTFLNISPGKLCTSPADFVLHRDSLRKPSLHWRMVAIAALL